MMHSFLFARCNPVANRDQSSGFSLIELLVAMVIGLVVSMAIYGVLASSEGRKRTTTSVNDIDQTGSFSAYQFDKFIRSAGAGFTGGSVGSEAFRYTYGCQLRAANGGAQVIPSGGYAAPFDATPAALRLLPILILDGVAPNGGGDEIIAMSGNGGLAEVASNLSANPSVNALNVKNVAAFRANDVLLVASTTAFSPCMLEQVNSTFDTSNLANLVGVTSLPLAGNLYMQTIAGTDLTSYTSSAVALNLGSTPYFNAFAVGDNNVLYRYDLLSPASTDPKKNLNPVVAAEGVYQMHAIYGVMNLTTCALSWQAPTGAYSAASLNAGTAAATAAMASIRAIKIGIVMKSALPEKGAVSGASIKLFDTTPIPVTVKLSPTNYRYRVFETTIPIRNTILIRNTTNAAC